MGCDGIFDKLENLDLVACVWRAVHDNQNHPTVKGRVKDVHKMCGVGVEYILKNSLLRRSLDNVTVVLIGFNNFKHAVFGRSTDNKRAEAATREQSVEEVRQEVHDQAAQLLRERTSIEKNKVIERTRSANLPKYQPS